MGLDNIRPDTAIQYKATTASAGNRPGIRLGARRATLFTFETAVQTLFLKPGAFAGLGRRHASGRMGDITPGGPLTEASEKVAAVAEEARSFALSSISSR